jgi:hypothetical protein
MPSASAGEIATPAGRVTTALRRFAVASPFGSRFCGNVRSTRYPDGLSARVDSGCTVIFGLNCSLSQPVNGPSVVFRVSKIAGCSHELTRIEAVSSPPQAVGLFSSGAARKLAGCGSVESVEPSHVPVPDPPPAPATASSGQR